MAEQSSPALADMPPPAADVADAGEARVQRWVVVKRFTRHRLALASLVIVFLLVLVAIFGNLLAPYDPYAQTFSPTVAPNSQHLLGTDDLGRDELSRIIVGARVSLGISSGAALVALVLGLLVGAVAGYFGGAIDNI